MEQQGEGPLRTQPVLAACLLCDDVASAACRNCHEPLCEAHAGKSRWCATCEAQVDATVVALTKRDEGIAVGLREGGKGVIMLGGLCAMLFELGLGFAVIGGCLVAAGVTTSVLADRRVKRGPDEARIAQRARAAVANR